MQHKWMTLLAALVLFSFIGAPVGAARAQSNLQGTTPDCPYLASSLMKDKGVLRSLPGECVRIFRTSSREASASVQAQNAQPATISGPDDFGYTFDDAVAYNWISADTNSGLAGDDEFSGPINIGFDFPFYGVAQSQLYFNTNGLITFGAGSREWNGYDIQIKNDMDPDNMIAPLWDDFLVGSPYNNGAIYYSQGGSAPNRYFVVEWRNVEYWYESTIMSFEVILHENGDILFQYQLVPVNYIPAVGIEDSTGYGGLQYTDYWNIRSLKAIRFSYPAPTARLLVSPVQTGGFAPLSGYKDFRITITNSGALGADTYDLTNTSTWPVTFYASNGATPLTDTDADTYIDTGPISQGTSTNVIARFSTPLGAQIGDDNAARINVKSSLDVSKIKRVYLSMGVPTNFANVFDDEADGAMSFMTVTSGEANTHKTTADGYLGYSTSVAKLTNGNYFYAWENSYVTGNRDWADIEYTVLGRNGNLILPVTKLTDNSSASVPTDDFFSSIAVAPDGTVGIVWIRRLGNASTGPFNYNVYFATLDSSGHLLTGSTNLTDNTVWGTYSDLNIPIFASATIAATDDNHFIIGWTDERKNALFGYVIDTLYEVRSSTGAGVLAPTILIDDRSERNIVLNSLTGGKVILISSTGSFYAVINSNGGIAKAPASFHSGAQSWSADAVQLPNGNVAIAWGWGVDGNVGLAILDSTYNLVQGPDVGYNPYPPLYAAGAGNLSVTTDASSHVIMSWSISNRLLYAMADSTGTFITDPMPYRMSGAYISGSRSGQGNAPYEPVYVIRGNTGVRGVTLHYSDGTPQAVTSDNNGNYSIALSPGWSGTVTPSRSGYTFDPVSRIYNNIQSDQTGQNYTAQYAGGADTTGVFRPSNGLLYLKNKNETGFADIALNYGIPGDYPVVGDWDGNGTVTIGIYRQGYFYLRNSNTIGFAEVVFPFGQPGDQPIAGDWNGDGVDTIGVFHPSNGHFFLRNSNSEGPAEMDFYLGNPGDVGLAGDWNGDGKDTTGVFRPANGLLYLKDQNTSGFADYALNYGIPSDKPVTGDWDNDGIDTIGVYRNGEFMLRNSNTIGFAEIIFGLGNPGDMPIAGNWDGLP